MPAVYMVLRGEAVSRSESSPSSFSLVLARLEPSPSVSHLVHVLFLFQVNYYGTCLGKVRKWLESGNKRLGKTVGIRWLRRKAELIEEGKKTSSIVVYLEEETEIDRVRLGGKLLRTTQYEPDRRRK
ncbi:hypothetical protein BDZ91DRAFT_413086 [Kalaharituber pfeilii]|nr:hypothetical protein BDZ91DRAFT_413086 [Kalaharituber pfeilii]